MEHGNRVLSQQVKNLKTQQTLDQTSLQELTDKVEHDNRILSQQVENLRARQTFDQTALQELGEKVDEKFN